MNNKKMVSIDSGDYYDIKVLAFFLFSFILPFCLLLIENLLSLSVFLEEFCKLILVICVFIFFKQFKQRFFVVFISVLIFSLSENIFYLVNLVQNQQGIDIFLKRFLFVTPMHIFTALIMFLSFDFGKRLFGGIFLPLVSLSIGFVAAFMLHAAFNEYFVYYI